MQLIANYSNTSETAEETFILAQYSSNPKDLPEPIQEELSVYEALQLEQGEWLMFADGEVTSMGFSAPFLIRADETDDEVSNVELGHAIYCPGCGEKIYEAETHTSNTGMNCPNGCGWIEVEVQGEDLVVKNCPTTY